MIDKTTETERLRQHLDERGVEWKALFGHQMGESTITATQWHDRDGGLVTMCISEPHGSTWDFFWIPTPEQAVEATLGMVEWSSPTWERWHQSLKHESVNTIGDAVEQLMYEAIEFGGDMGPNGNVYQGIDEGDVLTSGFINSWIERFEELGRGTCKVVSKPCDMWECECGKAWWHGGAPNYCPSCGRVAVLATPTDNATLSDLFGIWKEDE